MALMPGSCPSLVALLLCERAFQEAGTRNWCIIGVFDTMNVPQLPIVHPGFSVFVALSDFRGDAMVRLDIRHAEGGFVKAVRGKIPRIPMGLFQYVFPVPEVKFESVGVHTLELFADDQLVAVRSFRVQSTQPDPEGEAKRAEALFEEHKGHLMKDAIGILEDHPNASPVGLIIAPEAGQGIAFRQTFEGVFGMPPPEMTFVGIIDRGTALRLAGTAAEEAEHWLKQAPEGPARAIPVMIVTRSGFRFAFHGMDDFR